MQCVFSLMKALVASVFAATFPLATEGTISPLLLQEKDLDAEPMLGFCTGKKSEMLNDG